MTMQTEMAAMPRVIRDVDAARRELTRRRGFEETELSPRMQEGIRRVFGEDLTAEQVPVRMEPSLPGTWRWLAPGTWSRK